MRRAAKILSIAGLTLILLAFGFKVALHFFSPRDFPQTVRLPDGSKLTLLGISYGTNHVAPGPLPQRIVDRLPRSLIEKFKIPDRSSWATSNAGMPSCPPDHAGHCDVAWVAARKTPIDARPVSDK